MSKPFGLTGVIAGVACALFCSAIYAETVNVTVDVQTIHTSTLKKPTAMPPTQSVVWLTPVDSPKNTVAPGSYRLVQKDKMFRPHLLVIPVGSMVAFPNLDPFFHNVFSLFNGKRFDLGLYQAGSSKEVRFGQEGVSYIFCNIHPEMSAVIIVLATPYYGVAAADGSLLLRAVPAGSYQLNIWAEGADPQKLAALSRIVTVGPGHANLGSLSLPIDSTPSTHRNKFGENYGRSDSTLY